MSSIPTWLGAIGALVVIASALGTAVAVYRTKLQGTSLAEARDTIADLRGELGDYERREAAFKSKIAVLEVDRDSCKARIKVVEDLLLNKGDDETIRRDIAGLKAAVDGEVLKRLGHIVGLVEGLIAPKEVAS